jgi:hypothetical protein
LYGESFVWWLRGEMAGRDERDASGGRGENGMPLCDGAGDEALRADERGVKLMEPTAAAPR